MVCNGSEHSTTCQVIHPRIVEEHLVLVVHQPGLPLEGGLHGDDPMERAVLGMVLPHVRTLGGLVASLWCITG